MIIAYITSALLFCNEIIGVFIPGATVNMYGQMKIDINKTRAVVEQVIPPRTIANTARFDNVMLQFQNMMTAVDNYNAEFVRGGKEIVNLYVKYDSKPEEFQKVFAGMDAKRDEEVKKIIEARFKMKDVMTQEEWKAVFSPENKTKK